MEKMENSSSISLPRKKCMNCREERDILMSCCNLLAGVVGLCDHRFCQSCFRKENADLTPSLSYIFRCPCCHTSFYDNMSSIDEAILLGEAATISAHICAQSSRSIISTEDAVYINDMIKSIIDKLEAALPLNPTSFYILYALYDACCNGFQQFLAGHECSDVSLPFYGLKLFDYSFRLLDHPALSEQYSYLKSECYHEVALTFQVSHNYPTAYKYAKLAYEHCLRSSDHSDLAKYKDTYLTLRALFAELPPLRFAVGDEVEFLHELETGSEWKLGKVVELYHRERDFDVSFSAPYRLQLLNDHSDSFSDFDSADPTPVYAWVKADLDRYVRKVGVRSIEDTRYRTRLLAKFMELAQVFCSKKFIDEIYGMLAQDLEFVEMLQSVWQIELTKSTLYLYRMLVMHRQPLVRTDLGYFIPTTDDVIAGIKAYFDPIHLSGDAAMSSAGEDSDSQRVRDDTLSMFQGTFRRNYINDVIADLGIQDLLLQSIWNYIAVLTPPVESHADRSDEDSDSAVLLETSEAISKVSSYRCIVSMLVGVEHNCKLERYISAWVGLHACLEISNAGPACESPYVYFFIKFCLDQGFGVPKLALAMYDRMNMQLSREFIRCANPTCELNKLDQSTGQVKFKKCSRCHAVIYCSRECQVAHYPEHKRLCREHSTVREGS